MLIGNKCDLEDKRQVSYEEGEIFAKDYNMIFVEASARTSSNVEAAFIETARGILKLIESGKLDINDEVRNIIYIL
jgi:GTPase SAR1 family protein